MVFVHDFYKQNTFWYRWPGRSPFCLVSFSLDIIMETSSHDGIRRTRSNASVIHNIYRVVQPSEFFLITQILIHNFAQTLLVSRSVYVVDRIDWIFKFSLFFVVLTVDRRSLESAMYMFYATCRLEIVFVRPLRWPLFHIISALLTTQKLLNIRDMNMSFFFRKLFLTLNALQLGDSSALYKIWCRCTVLFWSFWRNSKTRLNNTSAGNNIALQSS